MTQVTVLFFGGLKDALACSSEVVCGASLSLSDVYGDLCRRHPELPRLMPSVRLALNEEFLPGMGAGAFEPNIALGQGDVLAFIPPVTGG